MRGDESVPFDAASHCGGFTVVIGSVLPGPPEASYFVVHPGRINLGPLTRPLYIPVSAIQSISMERIVLDIARDAIPREWSQPPQP